MSKILITGATGGLGSAVAGFLKGNKNTNPQIAVMVRDIESDKAKEFAQEGFEILRGDYNDKASLVKAFQGIDCLYFVSGNDIQNRMVQHKNVVEAVVEAKIGHVFYTSVSLNQLSADAPLYGVMSAHLETEKWIKDAGINYTFLRHNLYSEVIAIFLGTKEQLKESKTVFLPAGEGKTAFMARIELAEISANVLANPSEHANKIYELNGTEKVTFQQIAGFLSEILDEEIAYVSPEIKEFEETLAQHGVPAAYIGMMAVFGTGIADGVFDSPATDVERLLKRKPLPVRDFLEKVYQ